jgi:hypothetical protein
MSGEFSIQVSVGETSITYTAPTKDEAVEMVNEHQPEQTMLAES